MISKRLGFAVIALGLSVLPILNSNPVSQGIGDKDNDHAHRRKTTPSTKAGLESPWLNTDWFAVAQAELDYALSVAANVNTQRAKNVIIFLGDGMGLPTVASARLYHAELRNLKQQEIYLTWERFPHVGLSRTYGTDRSTTDSAATSTAYMCGVKANIDTLGVTEQVLVGNCSVIQDNKVRSIVKESIAEGKWTGFVTTTRITHASPAGGYAHSPERGWEGSIPADVVDRENCQDIAYQLMTDSENQQIHVLLGGGRAEFIPDNETDPVYGTTGWRTDGNNLLNYWEQTRIANGDNYAIVSNLTEFNNVDPATTDYLLGLFSTSHMDYELDRISRVPIREPSLSEMTEKAISILQRSPNGYFLFVEGGRIDLSHHDNNAQKALNDTLAFSDAVQKAIDLTSDADTLVLVTADHSHVFSFGGYASWAQSVLDFTDGSDASDGKPFLQLHYANGPGYYYHREDVDGNEIPRIDLTGVDIMDKEFQQDGGVPIGSETHGGEDVGIYASGPWSHLFHGNHEQNYIAHVMMYASCVGQYRGNTHCQVK